MISLLLIRKIAELFIIIILGYVIVKLKVLTSEESIVLSKISLYLIMPCVIINALQVDFTKQVKEGLLLAVAVSIAIHILLIGIGYVVEKLFHLDEVERASIIYSNAGNLLIPIVVAILGEKWVIYSIAFISVQIIFLWTNCKSMFSKEKKLNLLKIILNVNMLAIISGIFMLVSGLKLPAMINETIGSIGTMIGPVSMIITGMLVAKMSLKQIFVCKRIYLVTLLCMIIFPGIIMFLIKFSKVGSLVPNGKQILLITFLATATPTASTVTQFAQIHNKDAGYASAINIVTTMSCIVTMPFFVYLYYL